VSARNKMQHTANFFLALMNPTNRYAAILHSHSEFTSAPMPPIIKPIDFRRIWMTLSQIDLRSRYSDHLTGEVVNT
jgi:hypothetical protein